MAEKVTSDIDDEYLFSRDRAVFSPELLDDVLSNLAKRNDEAVRNPEEYLDYLSPSTTVELVFQTCARLKLPISVQLTAVEFLDRFLVQHVRDLRQQLGHPSGPAAAASNVSWDDVVTRLRGQVTLRLLSCIQLASKMSSTVRGVTIEDVRRMLQAFSDSYGTQSVLQSELRVLTTLRYRLDVATPLVYAGVLLDVIGHNDPSFNPRDLYPTTLRLLQGFYVVRHKVYERAFKHLAHDRSASQQEKTRRIRAFKADQLLLASSVVVSAMKVKRPKRYDGFLTHVHKVTRISKEEVHDLSCVIMAALFSKDPLSA
ncbi:cyclin N-terminal domain-containing protein 1-like isoform X2 [Haemaphysalis longicornis]